MKKVCAVPLLVLGLVMAAIGIYAVGRGFDARDEVSASLLAHEITTPAGASIPNTRVHDAATAQSFADFVSGSMDQATGGRNFSEIGHFLTPSGGDTDDPALATLDADGRPVPNPLRDLAFEATAGTTGLYTSVLAWHIGDLAIGLGIVLLALGLTQLTVGLVLVGVAVPQGMARRLHLRRVAPHHA